MAKVVVCRAILQTVQILVPELEQNFCKKNNRKKRIWVKHWINRREAQGASNNLIRELKLEDPTNYKNFLRMDENKFNDLLANFASKIKKQNTVIRGAISPQIKLEITNNKLILE
jgi:hypothetical protein